MATESESTRPAAGLSTDVSGRERDAVEAFGYRQDLRRTLRFFALFGVSFSVISITTGIFLNFGVGIDVARWYTGRGKRPDELGRAYADLAMKLVGAQGTD